jgi:hypothetical protein
MEAIKTIITVIIAFAQYILIAVGLDNTVGLALAAGWVICGLPIAAVWTASWVDTWAIFE